MLTLPAPSRAVVQVGQYNRLCCDSVLNEGQCLPAHLQSLEGRAGAPPIQIAWFSSAGPLSLTLPGPPPGSGGKAPSRVGLAYL